MTNGLMPWVASHAHLVPEPLVRAGFLAAADVAWLLRVGSVRQLERNLAHVLAWRDAQCTGGEADVDVISRRRLRAMSRRGMRSYFTYFSEALTVKGRTREQLTARIRGTGDGLASLKAQTGHGSAPVAMGHQGNWDYDGFWARLEVAPVTTVAERLADERTLRMFVDIRESLGINILLTGTPHLTERLEEALGRPHTVVPLLADRDLGRNGEFVDAFGSTIRVARGPATLAYDTGLPLYVANTYRERLHGERRKRAGSAHGYVCRISGPLDIDRFRGLEREAGIHAITQAWVDTWARGIADAPQDWHMLQPLFLADLDLSRLHAVPEEVRRRWEQEHA
ncbi:phosphatidylinositol mannoside acyltransferase [Bifidobacterium cuniculi]|uniref:Alpha-mannosyl-phosphatidylinositol acyltransferase n=1 Tax=Bifidobacterium cuniculi TaxID=1688 RepID=A0A087AW28_9BIFI|nr:phosphatidylinositol mannoside acyltransferase [Bifidobacterium cuniculi]KFI62978.1 Alpha-mannosyl-phosphatidylinositol acyltransferase [Bifidobacterium cuniculi]